MKKLVSIGAAGAVAVLSLISPVEASASTQQPVALSQAQTNPNVKPGVVVKQFNGYTETITTEIHQGNLQDYIKNLQANGQSLTQVGAGTTTQSMTISPNYLDNHSFSGYASSTNVFGDTEWVDQTNGLIQWSPVGGHVSATMIAYAQNSSYQDIGSSTAELDVEVYGMAGNGSYFSSTYAFKGNPAQVCNFQVNNYLNLIGPLWVGVWIYGYGSANGSTWDASKEVF